MVNSHTFNHKGQSNFFFLTPYQATKFYTSNLQAFADSKINVIQISQVLNAMRGKHGGKRRKCCSYQYFFFFPRCFQKLSFSGLRKVRIGWIRVKTQY